jgi:hypothetical protein
MTAIKIFSKCAGLLMIVQTVIWLAVSGFPPAVRSPAPDFLFEIIVFLYYPSVWTVERLGNFTGDSRLVQPIWYGVPLGIFCYSIVLAAIISVFMKKIRKQ